MMKDWVSIVEKTHIGVEWPSVRAGVSVHDFLRQNFGDNDIFEPYTTRRWIIARNQPIDVIYFRDEADAIWFTLKWGK